jgi:hypothetical protein
MRPPAGVCFPVQSQMEFFAGSEELCEASIETANPIAF